MTWWEFWVQQIWGNAWVCLMGTWVFFLLIGIIGRMSSILIIALSMLYFIVFLIGFGGQWIALLLFIASIFYFIWQLSKLTAGSGG